MLLSDVQESMRKRNPDSVSNLIRAATESDEVLAERKMQSQLVLEAKAELAGTSFYSAVYAVMVSADCLLLAHCHFICN